MNINEAEKLTGITKKTIRYYEEEGLLKVQREEKTGYRIFKEEDINRLKLLSYTGKSEYPSGKSMQLLTKRTLCQWCCSGRYRI